MAKSEVKRSERKRSTGKKAERRVDTLELEKYIETLALDVSPTLHINGRLHPSAVVTLDFGAPAKSIRFTNDQSHELMARMRKVARDVLGNDAPVRVSSDANNGNCVFWAAIQ